MFFYPYSQQKRVLGSIPIIFRWHVWSTQPWVRHFSKSFPCLIFESPCYWLSNKLKAKTIRFQIHYVQFHIFTTQSLWLPPLLVFLNFQTLNPYTKQMLKKCSIKAWMKTQAVPPPILSHILELQLLQQIYCPNVKLDSFP